MKLYRACKSTEVFPGAHFTDDAEEAEVYTKMEINNGGDAYGGSVREFTIEGYTLEVESITDLVQEILDYVGDDEEKLDDLGEFGEICQSFLNEDFGIWDVDASMVSKKLNRLGCDYVFHVIEKIDGVLSFLINNDEYDWIMWEAHSVKAEYDWKDDVTTNTYMWLGGGEVSLAN